MAGAAGPPRARGIIQAALTLRPCKMKTRLRLPCRWAGCIESPSGCLCCPSKSESEMHQLSVRQHVALYFTHANSTRLSKSTSSIPMTYCY